MQQLYQLIVGAFEISPGDFWQMQPYEFWWLIAAKKQQQQSDPSARQPPASRPEFDFNFHYAQLD